jgi:sulfhydrogenase subunit gamma (sulfur reductase)
MPSARIAARRDVGAGLALVTLDVDRDVAEEYVAPGQYVEVSAPGGAGFFVFAGEPGASRWELLVREVGGAAEALASLPLGTSLDVSRPLGAGFPLARAAGRPLVVAAVGSAIGVARPILRRRLEAGDAAATYLFFGVRTPLEVPLADEVAAWSERAHVVLCISRGEPSREPDWLPRAARASGYVQHELVRALGAGRLPRGAIVFAAGPMPMLVEMGAATDVEVVTNV